MERCEITVSQEDITYLQRYFYDYMVKRDIVIFILSNSSFNEDYLNSEDFYYYDQRYRQALYEYNLAKKEFERRVVPKEFINSQYLWSVSFELNKVFIERKLEVN